MSPPVAFPTSLGFARAFSTSLGFASLRTGFAGLRRRLGGRVAMSGERPSYWLARFVILRWLGFVYFVAFFSMANQLLPLLGSRGLLPVGLNLERIMLGAGLIKLRGDPCWQELTCLLTHYETQPVPHPLSWYFHALPPWILKLGVAFNHFAELVVPWFAFGPRRARHAAGALLVLFQLTLIASGNLSFLNWLTILPALACFDDSLWRRVLPGRLVVASQRAAANARPSRWHTGAVAALVAVVAVLSIGPVANLLSSRQVMNTSFGRLHLVNTYGAFGSVGQHRDEIILQGTSDAVIADDTVWKEYEWKCKPGDPMRRPCLITPYHYRLDWLIWFAAMTSYADHPWVVHLGWKLLHGDPGALSLLATNPFPDAPPRFVRAELYRYEFTSPDDDSDAWWKRWRLRGYLPPISADNAELQRFLRRYGWIE